VGEKSKEGWEGKREISKVDGKTTTKKTVKVKPGKTGEETSMSKPSRRTGSVFGGGVGHG